MISELPDMAPMELWNESSFLTSSTSTLTYRILIIAPTNLLLDKMAVRLSERMVVLNMSKQIV
jgi:hypothetical protein